MATSSKTQKLNQGPRAQTAGFSWKDSDNPARALGKVIQTWGFSELQPRRLKARQPGLTGWPRPSTGHKCPSGTQTWWGASDVPRRAHWQNPAVGVLLTFYHPPKHLRLSYRFLGRNWESLGPTVRLTHGTDERTAQWVKCLVHPWSYIRDQSLRCLFLPNKQLPFTQHYRMSALIHEFPRGLPWAGKSAWAHVSPHGRGDSPLRCLVQPRVLTTVWERDRCASRTERRPYSCWVPKRPQHQERWKAAQVSFHLNWSGQDSDQVGRGATRPLLCSTEASTRPHLAHGSGREVVQGSAPGATRVQAGWHPSCKDCQGFCVPSQTAVALKEEGLFSTFIATALLKPLTKLLNKHRLHGCPQGILPAKGQVPISQEWAKETQFFNRAFQRTEATGPRDWKQKHLILLLVKSFSLEPTSSETH